MKKSMITVLSLLFASVVFCQSKPMADSASSKKFYIVLNEAQINQLFYVIGTSAELSAADAKKYTQELAKQFQEVAPAAIDSSRQRALIRKGKE